jgi:hypothetical protein
MMPADWNINLAGQQGTQGPTGPALAANIALEVSLTANQTGVTASTWTACKYNNKITDTQNAYSTSTGLFTPTVAGVYAVSASIGLWLGASAFVGVAIAKNGSVVNAESQPSNFCHGTTGAYDTLTASALIYCNGTTDTISAMGYSGDVTFYAPATAHYAVNMVAVLLQTGPAGPPGPTGTAGPPGSTGPPGTTGGVNRQVFTTSGTYTPISGMRFADIECIGGGGAGANTAGNTGYFVSGGGGGAGGYSKKLATTTQIGASQVVTVGAGGAAASPGGPGTATSVGSLCVANGGQGGTNGGAGGAGGTPGTGDIAAPGATGLIGTYSTTTNSQFACSNGGNTIYGAGGQQASFGSGVHNGPAGTGYGAGGAGGMAANSTSGATGGAGAPGIVIITEYY